MRPIADKIKLTFNSGEAELMERALGEMIQFYDLQDASLEDKMVYVLLGRMYVTLRKKTLFTKRSFTISFASEQCIAFIAAWRSCSGNINPLAAVILIRVVTTIEPRVL